MHVKARLGQQGRQFKRAESVTDQLSLTIEPRFAFYRFMPGLPVVQKLLSFIHADVTMVARRGQRLRSVRLQQFRPILAQKRGAGKQISPHDASSNSYYDPNGILVPQSLDETFIGLLHRLRDRLDLFLDHFVGPGRCVRTGAIDFGCCGRNFNSLARARHTAEGTNSGTRAPYDRGTCAVPRARLCMSCCGCAQIFRHLSFGFTDLSPHLLLALFSHRSLTYARLGHYRCMCIELVRRFNPAVRFYAKHAKIDRIALGRHDAVFAHHPVLLPASDDLTSQEYQRAFPVVDQNQIVDAPSASNAIGKWTTSNHRM